MLAGSNPHATIVIRLWLQKEHTPDPKGNTPSNANDRNPYDLILYIHVFSRESVVGGQVVERQDCNEQRWNATTKVKLEESHTRDTCQVSLNSFN